MTDARAQQAPAHYVVGYCFNYDYSAVILIEKRKPAWQAGKLNGIGGKIEPTDPSPSHAMAREFEEEAGIHIPAECWLHFHTERFAVTTPRKSDQDFGTQVYHFATFARPTEWRRIRTMTQEEIVRAPYPLTWIGYEYIYNIPYLVPMAAILVRQPAENRPAV